MGATQTVMFVNEKEPFQIPLAAPLCKSDHGISESLSLRRVLGLRYC